MNGAVVVVVSAFFIIGITVGVIAVVAMSARRGGRPGHPGDPGGPMEYGPRRTGWQPPDSDWDDAVPEDHSSWPAHTNNDFSGE
jgi:hypothetical protein